MNDLQQQINQLELSICLQKKLLEQQYLIIKENATTHETILPAMSISFIFGFLLTQKKSYAVLKLMHNLWRYI